MKPRQAYADQHTSDNGVFVSWRAPSQNPEAGPHIQKALLVYAAILIQDTLPELWSLQHRVASMPCNVSCISSAAAYIAALLLFYPELASHDMS